ncbi:ArnT family glycosyltransferase [Methylobacterium iners]|uniref:Glycosyltransferase RgtA/B/C/D-like domain-containing protein n=1 Tax=Methylobacterium iners TaxID=418707 RepID=A0ABQ4RZG1_9HYPH|nr:hypothetical protein [Methylobacterium iners]GJD94905.1 hypothetical protein OCOJLMKI_2112 [Methylobacterium iners]
MSRASTHPHPAHGIHVPGRSLAALGLVLLAGSLVAWLVGFVRASAVILPYPYDFDYGEGIVWQQMRDIMRGDAYGPLGVLPSIVYHYPPVYHLTTALLAGALGLDELLAGRLVSLLSTLASGLLVAGLSADALGRTASTRTRIVCGALGGLVFLTCMPVMKWAPLMRVDLLACALSLAGLALAVRALERPGLIHLAGLCFVLAVYTKQVSIAAPAAAFIGLLAVAPRLALAGISSTVAMGAVALVGLWVGTGGGFVRHVFLYNANRLDPPRVVHLWLFLSSHVLYVAVALSGIHSVWPQLKTVCRNTRRADRQGLALLVVTAFLALKTLMLPMIMKSGAAENYFTEWCCALAIFIGIALRSIVAQALDTQEEKAAPSPTLTRLLVMVLPLQVWLLPHWSVSQAAADARARDLAPLVAMIQAEDRPVVSDDMTLPLRAGRRVVWEPAIAAELAHSGLYDEAAFVSMIRRRELGFFVTLGRRGDPLFDERYNPPVAAAIDAAYPSKREIGGLTLHLPER